MYVALLKINKCIMTIDVLNRFAKTGFSLLVCLVSVLSVSCDADSSVAVSDDRNDGYLQLEFSRDMTRADIGNDGSGSFSAGDVVGLYIDNGDNVEYRELTYDGSEWLPRLERSEFGFGELVLSAQIPLMRLLTLIHAVSTPPSRETVLPRPTFCFPRSRSVKTTIGPISVSLILCISADLYYRRNRRRRAVSADDRGWFGKFARRFGCGVHGGACMDNSAKNI